MLPWSLTLVAKPVKQDRLPEVGTVPHAVQRDRGRLPLGLLALRGRVPHGPPMALDNLSLHKLQELAHIAGIVVCVLGSMNV